MKGRILAAALLIALLSPGVTPARQTKEEGNEEKRNERHGWLGVSIQDVTPRAAREMDLKVKSGALVNGVTEESPAEDSGIKEHDVIVEFNGKTVDESDDLLSAVRSASPGDKASVTFYRGQEKKTVQVTLGKAPRRDFAFSFRGPGHINIPHPAPMPRIHIFRSEGVLGLSLTDLNRQLGEYFQAPNGRGVLVQEVKKESPGEKAGFKAGDVILRAGKEDVETTEDIMEAMEGLKKGEKIEFGILRKGARTTLTAESEGPERERWNGFRSFEFNNDMGMEPNILKRDMEKLKEELRSIGTRIRSEMQEISRKLRGVTS
jgi:membrane-associated protease RseP (regulator of RpoE activity)